MIKVDGFKAFHGTLHITPTIPKFKPFSVTGDCLYNPHTNCWYVQPDGGGLSESYPADMCLVQED